MPAFGNLKRSVSSSVLFFYGSCSEVGEKTHKWGVPPYVRHSPPPHRATAEVSTLQEISNGRLLCFFTLAWGFEEHPVSRKAKYALGNLPYTERNASKI